MGFGDYPAEFNPKIHGPYHPGRFYGKADTPLGEVKLGEFGKWLSRRNYTPQGMPTTAMLNTIKDWSNHGRQDGALKSLQRDG
ncbi:hypothetical protein C0Q70_01727 [Pomacea canaliculata]|uniref:ATP synthase subunit f, mitochondrial n=1 Tax=Pomacea canaliculata TaxID=400727 RepID=A0A2T7Q0A7_POMCA|nr:hypothetical protein C0Q70_01727 [Pomacea canaliculata]